MFRNAYLLCSILLLLPIYGQSLGPMLSSLDSFEPTHCALEVKSKDVRLLKIYNNKLPAISVHLQRNDSGRCLHGHGIRLSSNKKGLYRGTIDTPFHAEVAFNMDEDDATAFLLIVTNSTTFAVNLLIDTKNKKRIKRNNLMSISVMNFIKRHPGNTFCGNPIKGKTKKRPTPRKPTSRRQFGRKTVKVGLFYDEALFNKFKGSESELNKFLAMLLKVVQIYFDKHSLADVVKITFSVQYVSLLRSKEVTEAEGKSSEMLSQFCDHQAVLSPRNWDYAILLSGLNLWNTYDGGKTVNDEVTGLAYTGGFCLGSPEEQCSLVEVKSFQAGLVLTHEVGHSFGMSHDGDLGASYCNRDQYIMSPSTGPGKLSWSSCSVAAFVSHMQEIYINDRMKDCFENKAPIAGFDLSLLPDPGEGYDVDAQCAFHLGSEYHRFMGRTRSPYNNICKVIWCSHQLFLIRINPALPGTLCATRSSLSSTYRCDADGNCIVPKADNSRSPAVEYDGDI